jgi:signal transduction histidine kinase
MFRTLRWRLTLWFVLLSVLVYAGLLAIGLMLFHAGLTSALDEELAQLSQELIPNIDYDQDGTGLQLRVWPTKGKHRSPIKLLAAIELFDRNQHLVQQYGQPGPAGAEQFFPGVREISGKDSSRRSLNTAIYSGDGHLVGYLQIQLTTKLRDHATAQFGWTMASIAPLLLLALGISGYFFSGKAAKPIEETFVVLRQFVSDAGHELGTPIAIIQAATENLQEQLPNTPHLSRLNIISRNTERMSRLVQDLTLLARVDAGSLTKPTTTVSLDRLTKTCVEEFEDRFNEKRISLIAEEIQPASVIGDPDSLHRMLSNLIENALRYTNEGGRVTVSLRVLGRVIKLSVEDTGIGIPSDSVPHLFDRFYRVDQSRSRAEGGFGLGLSIVRAIAASYRGSVEVSSEPGKGSRFSIVLPVNAHVVGSA